MQRSLTRSGWETNRNALADNKDAILVGGAVLATVFGAGMGLMSVKNQFDLQQAELRRQRQLEQAEQRRQQQLEQAEQRRVADVQKERLFRQLAEERARFEQRLFDAAFHEDYQKWRRARTAPARKCVYIKRVG